MAYALGIELTDAAVRVAMLGSLTEAADELVVPTVLHVEEDHVAVGSAAVELGAQRPAGLVRDVVSQFTVDRLWFAGGRMLTPDDAMAELLGGAARLVRDRRDESAGAVTVAHPDAWDDAAVARLAAVTARLGLARVELVGARTAADAARHAALRLPAAAPVAAASSLPMLEPAMRASRPGPSAPVVPQPTRAAPVLRRVGGPTVFAVVLAALAVTAVVVVSRRGGERSGALVPLTVASTLGTAAVTTTTVPRGSLTVGVVAGAATVAAVGAAVARLNAAGGVFGHDVFVVAQTGAAPAGLVDQLRRQGSNVLVTDASGDVLAGLLAAAGGVPVCVTTAGAALPTGSLAGLVLLGPPDACTVVLALAADGAGSLDPGRIAGAGRDLLSTAGIICSTYEQCRAFVESGQPISFRPTGESVRLAPST